MPNTAKFNYVIRPDGTIRRVTQGPVTAEAGEIIVQSATMRQPGLWFYDFDIKQLVEYTRSQLQARGAAKRATAQDVSAALRAKQGELRTKIRNQPAEMKRILELMAELAGVKL